MVKEIEPSDAMLPLRLIAVGSIRDSGMALFAPSALGLGLLLLLLLLFRRGYISQPQPSLGHVGQSSPPVTVSKRARHF